MCTTFTSKLKLLLSLYRYAGQLERKKATLVDEAEFHNAQLSDTTQAKSSVSYSIVSLFNLS